MILCVLLLTNIFCSCCNFFVCTVNWVWVALCLAKIILVVVFFSYRIYVHLICLIGIIIIITIFY